MNKKYMEGVQNEKRLSERKLKYRVDDTVMWLYCSLARVRDKVSTVQRPEVKRD